MTKIAQLYHIVLHLRYVDGKIFWLKPRAGVVKPKIKYQTREDLSLQNREENAQYLFYIRCRLSSTRIIIVKYFLGEDCAEQ